MIFDQLLGVIERHYKDFYDGYLYRLCQDAKIFDFPATSHKILPKKINKKDLDFIKEYFILPFPVVAVEDTASCTILADLKKDQVGPFEDRVFLDCVPSGIPYTEFREEEQEHLKMNELLGFNLKDDQLFISGGKYRFIAMDESRYLSNVQLQFMILASKDKIYLSPEQLKPMIDDSTRKAAAMNAKTALEEIMYFNDPKHFILESAPVKQRSKEKKLARSHERPKYFLLTPQVIREKLSLPDPVSKHKSPAAHERRRHIRTLKSERFTKKRGQKIFIPATWVGPKEAVVKNRRYKVRLDL